MECMEGTHIDQFVLYVLLYHVLVVHYAFVIVSYNVYIVRVAIRVLRVFIYVHFELIVFNGFRRNLCVL